MYLYYFVIMATANGLVWWFAYIPPDAHSLSNTSNTKLWAIAGMPSKSGRS